MESTRQRNEAIRAWREHCEHVAKATAEGRVTQEDEASRSQRIQRLRNDYAAFCEHYFPHYLTLRDKVSGKPVRVVHNAPFHNQAARKVRQTPDLKAVFMWPRGHAKSTHFDIFMPLWLIFQQQPLVRFMVVVGKSWDSAARLLGDIQAELTHNQRIRDDFGEQATAGDWQEGEFTIKSGAHFLAVGRGQSPRGLRDREARPDYIVMDDLDDDELCRNDRRVREMTEWVKEALFGALDVGRGRFIMVGNLISRTSVLANIAATKGVHVSKVCALDAKGDPVWKDKWTRQEAEAYRDFVGFRAWEKEMQHNPITEGAMFRREWIRYKKPLPLGRYDDLVCYVDPSLKPKTTNDYKAVRLWGRTGREFHLLDAFVRQGSVTAMVKWMYDLHERTRDKAAVRFYMEANFCQDTLLDEFQAEGDIRGYQLPVMPDKRQKPDKLARIEAVSPLWERGLVYYNADKQDDPDMQTGIEQTLGLEKGSSIHDDAPDADEGAIWIMQRSSRCARTEAITLAPRRKAGKW